MNAIKLWVWLMAKRLIWLTVAMTVVAAGRFAWQNDWVSLDMLTRATGSAVKSFASPKSGAAPWPSTPRSAHSPTSTPADGPMTTAPAEQAAVDVSRYVPASAQADAASSEPVAPMATPPVLPLRLDRETACLARAIHHEAAHDSLETRIAIAHVAMVRLAQAAQHKSMCTVVYGGMNTTLGCLFVATCRAYGAAEPTGDAWHATQQLAREIMTGKIDIVAATGKSELVAATHFHTASERPAWSSQVVRLAQVGRFVFSSRKPAVDDAAMDATATDPPSEKALANQPDQTQPADRKAGSSPRKPLPREAKGGGAGSVKPADGWFNQGQ